MTTFFPIDLNCSVCGAEFKSSEIGSCGFASKRTDFRPNYWGFNPVFYFFHLCPECGFCGPKNFFELEIEKPEIKENLKDLESLNDPSLPEKLERAMICLELLNQFDILNSTNLDLAYSWIRPYWWAETQDEQKKFAEIVLSYFSNAIANDDVSNDELMNAKYLMAEINRRIGNHSKANNLFEEVISLTCHDDSNKLYQLAVQQSTEPKDLL